MRNSDKIILSVILTALVTAAACYFAYGKFLFKDTGQQLQEKAEIVMMDLSKNDWKQGVFLKYAPNFDVDKNKDAYNNFTAYVKDMGKVKSFVTLNSYRVVTLDKGLAAILDSDFLFEKNVARVQIIFSKTKNSRTWAVDSINVTKK